MPSGETADKSTGKGGIEGPVSAVLWLNGSETREEDRLNERCSCTPTVILVRPSRVGGRNLSVTTLFGDAADRRDEAIRTPFSMARMA